MLVRVKMGEKVWDMSRKYFDDALVPIAKENVPFGVYAVEKNGNIDMVLGNCQSITQLKNLIRQYKSRGFKVMVNGR